MARGPSHVRHRQRWQADQAPTLGPGRQDPANEAVAPGGQDDVLYIDTITVPVTITSTAELYTCQLTRA